MDGDLAQLTPTPTGERAGILQKISRRGWVCKTWEGELQMTALPGATPEKFLFTVRSDSVAAELNRVAGQRVVLNYKQHVGVPGSCFGDTQYYIVGREACSAPRSRVRRRASLAAPCWRSLRGGLRRCAAGRRRAYACRRCSGPARRTPIRNDRASRRHRRRRRRRTWSTLAPESFVARRSRRDRIRFPRCESPTFGASS